MANADLFAITETGCNDSIHDAEICPPGFTILRCDRADGRKQGGACLVATPRFELRRVSLPNDVNVDDHMFELVCANVYLRKRCMFLLCVLYIPPGSSDSEYMIIFNIIEQLCNKYRDIVVLGDFNLYSCSVAISNYYEYLETFCEFTQSNVVRNCNGRYLDLVLSTLTEGGSVSVRAAEAPLVPVDAYHPPLDISVSTHTRLRRHPSSAGSAAPSGNECVLEGWNFNKADLSLLYSLIAAVDWTTLYEMDLEVGLNYFYYVINSIIDDCVPKKKRSCVKSGYIYPEWYTSEIIRDIKLKAFLHKRFKASGSKEVYEAFARCRTRVKEMMVVAHKQYCDRVQSQMRSDPKAFWNYTKSKRCRRNQQEILKDGEILSGQQCVDEFAEYFHSVYRADAPVLDVDAAVAAAGNGNGAARVHLDQLTLADVYRALQDLKPKRSAGPDGIPPYIFKDCRSVLAKPLLHIYNQCLQTAVFPEKWKLTRVVPVSKGGLTDSVDGFRPVAVLSTPAKVLETAIHKSIYLQVSSQLSDAQHGFRPGRSTTSNLLCHMAHLIPTVDSGVQADAAYFDFRKAFDLVDNDMMLRKLASVGFTPHSLRFFASYLRDRRQYVEYEGHVSDPYFTRSGVSQGSNLGPLGFLLVVNDLPEVVKDAHCLMFADDLKLSLAVKSGDDCVRLQRDIDRVVSWSKENLLQFNFLKCVTITFSRAHNPIVFNYHIDKAPMVRVTEVRDLGVSFNTSLTFRDHITRCCRKAFRNLGFMLRTVRGFTNVKAIIALYNALVRSQLECNAVIWSPHEAKYSLMLERVQNKFIRYLYSRYYGVYPFYPLMYPTLFILGMVGYNELRVRRDLTMTSYLFQILRGKLHNIIILGQLSLCVPDRYVWRRRRPRLLVEPRGRTNLLGEAPLTRALRTLNLIAEETDLFWCTLGEFTRKALFIISYR